MHLTQLKLSSSTKTGFNNPVLVEIQYSPDQSVHEWMIRKA
jgi:hypothetical protein